MHCDPFLTFLCCHYPLMSVVQSCLQSSRPVVEIGCLLGSNKATSMLWSPRHCWYTESMPNMPGTLESRTRGHQSRLGDWSKSV
eukprot:1216181-Amphidinium_carterae.1